MSAEVDEFLAALDHPQKETIEYLRAVILDADPDITEHVKWNAPSFVYEGDDRVTFQLGAENGVQVIFHRGAKVKDDQADFTFSDVTGLLKWISADRGSVVIRDLADAKTKKPAVAALVRNWINA